MKLNVSAFDAFGSDWALVTAGKEGHYNTMTISWGGLGTIWAKPVATVYAKPIRYTHKFLDEYDYFTISFFPPEYKEALGILGKLSGRDGDKVAKAGLTPLFLEHSVTFKEASRTLVCRKLYRQDLDASLMPADVVERYYTTEPAHTMFIGEVLAVLEQ